MTIGKTARNIGIAYLVMVLAFAASVIGVNYIPRERIVESVRETSEIITGEGAYYNPTGNVNHTRDNFTDALMVNIAMTADERQPVQAAMNAGFWGIC